MKAFELTKTNYEFDTHNESGEFKEYIEYVFEGKNTIYLVFKKGFTNENPIKHIKKYYMSRGWIKVKFFKQ
jgi:hypothetical protein